MHEGPIFLPVNWKIEFTLQTSTEPHFHVTNKMLHRNEIDAKTGSVDPSRRSHLSKPSHKPNGGGVAGRKHVNDCSHPLAPAAQAADWLTFPDGRLQGLHHAAPLLA